MKLSLTLRSAPPAPRIVRTTRSHRARLHERLEALAWRRVVVRRGVTWLNDVLVPGAAPCIHSSGPSRVMNEAVASEGLEGTMLVGAGNSLAAQLRAIGSSFVKDILIRRAACAMAQIHQAGGYLGYARAEHMEVMGNDVDFADFECAACDSLDVASAQTRDWLLFTSSVASHYDTRPHDLAAILFRATRALPTSSAEALRHTVNSLAVVEHAWCRLFGRHLRAMRTAVLALRTGFAWQKSPECVRQLPVNTSNHRALARFLDLR